MKTILYFLFLIPLGLLLSSCGTAIQPAATPWPESMKGYELYSWRENDHWVFSLLVGTNREKTLDEIKSADTILPDTDALIATLDKIPSGQYVTWSSRETLSFPPEDIIEQVEKTCKDRGLILNIAR
jgi:hypothetical protein